MRILVTGGAGFIGGHLAEAFVSENHDVTVLDNFRRFYDTEIKRHNVEAAREAANQSRGSYELVRGDVRNEKTVSDIVEPADMVFHQAAQAGVRASAEQPREITEINVIGAVNVLEAARNSDSTRVVVAGSSSAYGKPEYLPYDEAHPTSPVSPYGASKLSTDHYARVYHELYGLPTVVLRYFTVSGPRMRPNMAISTFVSRCMNGKRPVIYGDGAQTRDMTHVEDIINANHTLLSTDAADGEIVNIGSNDNVEIVELAREIRDQINPDLPLEYSERHDADAEHTHADVSKARDLLGYEPEYTIQEGVSTFIEWYRNNRDWYEPLVMSS